MSCFHMALVALSTVIYPGVGIRVEERVLRVNDVPHTDLSWSILLNTIMSPPTRIITSLPFNIPLSQSQSHPGQPWINSFTPPWC
jgi:hypothetical protein